MTIFWERVVMSVVCSTVVQLLVFFCSSVPVAQRHTHQMSQRAISVKSSFFGYFGFICDFFVFRLDSWSFGVIGLILSQSENRVPLKPGRDQCCTITLLHMKRLTKNESAIFVSLIQRIYIQNLFCSLMS